MANTTRHAIENWDNFHNNGPWPAKMLYKTSLEGKGNMPSVIDRYNDAAKEIQKLLKEALDAGEGFRAFGSAWSLNNIAHNKDRLHFNSDMNIKKPILDDEMHPASTYKKENLFLVQCGNTIKEISIFAGDHGKSIKTSGASNGQTIAGSISTGIHGSAWDTGAVQDSVVGLNLIIGPAAEDNIYLERHTQPALSNSFAAKINARVIRNDGLFNAALVGLGAFGFIHGVVIETTERFLLKRYVRKIPKEQALELAANMNFDTAVFKIPEELEANGNGLFPYHYKIFINPYFDDGQYVVEIIYKKPYRQDYPDPFPRIKTALYKDLIILFSKIVERCRNSIPRLIKMMSKDVLPAEDQEVTGTIGEIFWDAPHQGGVFACSVGVDHKDSPRALELLANLARNEGPVPGMFAMRFVKGSKATMACTRFPVTCMLEIDGILWKGSRKIISLEKFSTRILEILKNDGIPFTIHWGKNADWGSTGLIAHMYGNDALKWREYRSALLGEDMAKVFSNGFTDQTGLSEFDINAMKDLIASLD